VKALYASLFHPERTGRLADGGGEAGHAVEHDVRDAGVGRNAAREPEEEVGDERERVGRERRHVRGEGVSQERRGVEERQVERWQLYYCLLEMLL
jgi:hypothetical protein